MKSNILPVLQTVVGDTLHRAVLVEIDRDDPLVDDLLLHERDFCALSAARCSKIPRRSGSDGGRRAHHDQDLILAGTDRNLLQCSGGQDVALLELLTGARSENRADEGYGGGYAQTGRKRDVLG